MRAGRCQSALSFGAQGLRGERPLDFVIAVDGPAASGKGTVASGLARDFGLPYLDTGILYRAVGVGVLAQGGDPDDAEAAAEVARLLKIEAIDAGAIRTAGAGEAASRVAAHPQVRAALNALQRDFALQSGGAVLDGRDIGTVIAPDAAAKLFVTATPETRAERRWRQLGGQGETLTLEAVLEDIRRRDARDQGRASAPLVRASDAALLDTTDLSISQAADAARRIVEAARARWEKSRG
jgi:cytidylate kinase